MDEERKPLSAVTVGPLGFCECDNAPATFEQLMETCLGDLNLNWCIIYLDDIVIFLKDEPSHLVRLEAMFQKLKQARLKHKPSKCELYHRHITYLGHIISTQGVANNEEKVSIIKKCPIPTTVTKVQSFLGFTGYYHQFIPWFAQIAQPLHTLMSGKMQVNRGQPSLGMTDASSPLMN